MNEDVSSTEKQYLMVMRDILENGIERPDRTGTGVKSVFGRSIRHDFGEGFPLFTTKKMFWRGIVEELLWMLRGEDNIAYLKEKGVAQIWEPWASKSGWVGDIYGVQWRTWEYRDDVEGDFHHIDQLQNAIDSIKANPYSRRHLVLAWNPAANDQGDVALPCCHYAYQFYVEGNRLNISFTMRSSDFFIGTSWNIASYALLLTMVSHLTGYEPGQVLFNGTDVHLYSNHYDQVKEQLSREPHPLPQLKIIRDVKNIDDFKYEDFELAGYDPHPAIKAPLAV